MARRDAVLASSTLPEQDRATLRALPFCSLEFFGPEAAALFLAREKEKQLDALVRMAMVPPKSPGPKRKRFGGQIGGQAKKHKPASASQPSLSQLQAMPCPFSFYLKKKVSHIVKARPLVIGSTLNDFALIPYPTPQW